MKLHNHLCAEYRVCTVVKIIGFKSYSIQENNITALMYASRKRQHDVVKLLHTEPGIESLIEPYPIDVTLKNVIM